MRHALEIIIDDDVLRASGMTPDKYRRIMGSLQEYGIRVITPQETDLTRHEIRSGLEWDIAYRGGDLSEPIAGHLAGHDGREFGRIAWNQRTEAFDLRLKGQDPKAFDTFDEALDAATWHAYSTPSWEREGLVIHELTGREGIYDIGSLAGTDYVVNAFWSDTEPGYINYGVFAVQGEQMDILTSGFFNGYTAIEDAVRDLADEFMPPGSSQIRFLAYCDREFNLAAEYREALDEGRIDHPVRIPTNADINDPRETFYFSFGTAEFFPFKQGWVEVRADDREEACEMFSSHFPRRDGLLNCSFVYSESEWKQTEMAQGGPGQVCHQVISDWGPHKDSPDQDLNALMNEMREKARAKNLKRQSVLKDRNQPPGR